MSRKTVCLLILPFALLAGCVNPPIVQEYMIINPHSVIFPKGDSVSAVAITHSCTCPFTWTSKVIPDSASRWLIFPLDTTGDHASIQVSVLPSLMSSDTNRAVIVITSNSYGIDTIHVVAYGPKS